MRFCKMIIRRVIQMSLSLAIGHVLSSVLAGALNETTRQWETERTTESTESTEMNRKKAPFLRLKNLLSVISVISVVQSCANLMCFG